MNENNIYDVVIIGGSAAGLTAAIYSSRKKLKTLVITKNVGGQNLLTETIENYPGFLSISGPELSKKMREQVERYEVPIKTDMAVEKIEKEGDEFVISIKDGENIRTKTIIVATGKLPRRLNIPGEKEFENKGVSFCSTCDAPLFGDKVVAVIGGGNAGLDAALDLTKYATKVFVVVYKATMKGDELTQELLKKTGKVEFVMRAETKEIVGSNFVEKIIYTDAATNTDKELAVQGVFVNIGQLPATEFLKDFIDLDEYGHVKINHQTNETTTPGIFAAGDVSDSLYKQAVIAAGEGAKAALSAYHYLVDKDKK